jgi:hypothetical protein
VPAHRARTAACNHRPAPHSPRPLKVAACAGLVAWLHFALGPAIVTATGVQIPNGRTVDLAFRDTLSPETTTVGETVLLTVVEDVVIDGHTVIAKGALAKGEVVRAEKQGSVGKAAALQVELRSVEAVDGTVVPVHGTKSVVGEEKQGTSLAVTILCCILGLLMKGGQAEIPAGTTVRGTIVGPASIEVPE